jgi:serine protease Do
LDEAGELSPRRSGFPEVIVHDSVLAPEHCGGPIIDISGRIVGINIARAGRHATYAIPSTSVLELTRRLSLLHK